MRIGRGTVDKRRVTRRLGEIDAGELASVQEGVRLLLGF